LIETIYLDVTGDSGRLSRYTLLVEKLHAAERAHIAHEEMSARVSLLHLKRIRDAQRELEAEGERLRKLIKTAAGS